MGHLPNCAEGLPLIWLLESSIYFDGCKMLLTRNKTMMEQKSENWFLIQASKHCQYRRRIGELPHEWQRTINLMAFISISTLGKRKRWKLTYKPIGWKPFRCIYLTCMPFLGLHTATTMTFLLNIASGLNRTKAIFMWIFVKRWSCFSEVERFPLGLFYLLTVQLTLII